MNKDIQFLKELQQELKSQSNDGQASPRYWVVGDYKMVQCSEGCEDVNYIYSPLNNNISNIESLLEDVIGDYSSDYDTDVFDTFNNIDSSDDYSALEWMQENYDEDAFLVPMREEHFTVPNTMFITKQDCISHIEANDYHYSSKVHTYAMTAWRSPKVEKLWKILEEFDWGEIK